MQLPDFLNDESTRSILTWLGTGVGTVVGAVWAVYKFRSSKAEHNTKPTVSAKNGSISAGRDVRDNKIEMHSDRKH
jgi:hypothetical protein